MITKLKSIDSTMKFLAILFIISLFGIVSCFNLENRLPIYKFDRLEDSYFGYSVASHVQVGYDGDEDTKWILVGAPLGQNLQPGTNRSGAVFKCPISQSYDDCQQIITDGLKSVENNILNPPLDTEVKDGQWMGVTVASEGVGGMVLTCAHRYIHTSKNKETQYGQGLCYILNNDLEYDDFFEPCKGRSTERAHEQYSYCQAGTSGVLLDGNAVVGSPGPFTWRGSLFTRQSEGDYLRRDKTTYYSPHDDSVSPVEKYSYLGMAVTGGKYFGDKISYVGGAPRSNGHGQVVIFEKSALAVMNVVEIIEGEQFASNFGYELETADINGDGLPDLLVSAPFYFSRDEGGAVYVYQNNNFKLPKAASLKLTGKFESRFGLAVANMGDINKDHIDDIAIGAPYEKEGVVYIYLGSKDGLSKVPSQVIRASDLGLKPSRRITTFGSSLSGSVDVDDNGYPDLIVGAYNSSAAIALLSRPITNIKTEVTSVELKNIDPSKNGCVADPSTNLTCFSFKACCSIDPYGTPANLRLIYTIEAETYSGTKKFSRVFFGPDSTKRSNIIKRNIQVMTDGKMTCNEETVYIKENTRDIQSPIKFRLNYTIVEPPLPYSGLQSLHPILDQTEADRQFEASFQKDCGTDEICQTQLIVAADLELNKDRDGKYVLILGQSESIQLKITVENSADSAYEAQLFVVHQPSVTYIAASKGTAICNKFNETVVSCTLGNPLKRDGVVKTVLRFDPTGLEDSAPKMSFVVFANSTSKQITPQDNVMLMTKVVKKAELSITGWPLPEQTFFGGEVKGESAMKYFSDVGQTVEHIYQIYNDGPWKAPHVEVDILWPHQVANDKPQGKWALYLEELPRIDPPEGGECTLDRSLINPLGLENEPLDEAVSQRQIAPAPYTRMYNKSQAYTMRLSEKSTYTKMYSEQSSSFNHVRRKRDRAMVIRPESLIDKEGKRTDIVTMDCNKSTAKCIKINCKIYNMQRKSEVYIHVRSRLWNSTFVMDYPRVDTVKIVSRASLSIPEMFDIQQNKHDDSADIETHAYPELLNQAGDGTIPYWIIILGILGGLLLLALVTFVLWKLGFFKRRRPDPTLSGNLQKKSSETKPFL